MKEIRILPIIFLLLTFIIITALNFFVKPLPQSEEKIANNLTIQIKKNQKNETNKKYGRKQKGWKNEKKKKKNSNQHNMGWFQAISYRPTLSYSKPLFIRFNKHIDSSSIR